MKYEQIVNKIILILFCRTLYRGSIYRTTIYNVKLDYPICQAKILDKYPIIQVAKMYKKQLIVIYPNRGIVYILKHELVDLNQVMCSTQT